MSSFQIAPMRARGSCRTATVTMGAVFYLFSCGVVAADGYTTLDAIQVNATRQTLDTIQVVGTRKKSIDLPLGFGFGGSPGGGGGSFIGTSSPPAPKKADADPCGGDRVGNPVMPSTGNKIEPETDFQSAGEMGLGLSRTYNHYWEGVGIFGKYWVSNFDYKLTFGSSDVNACYPRPGGGLCSIGTNAVVYAQRPDARSIKFIKQADGIFYEDKAGPVARIVPQPDGSFVLYNQDDGVETYTSAGYVKTVKDQQGIGWTYTYSGTYPTRVTHTSGRYVDFVWNNGQLTSVRDPAGNYYGFAYLANRFGAGLHLLAATAKPGAPATSITYHYEDSRFLGALTGKSYNGVRYSTFTYNADGYATSSEHNGANKYTFSYSPGINGALTVVQTNPLGKVTTSTFANGKPRTITGQASTYCAASYAEITYDSNGYPQVQSDFNGNTTSFTYNAKGQLVQQIDAYGTAIARKTVNVWDTVRNRIISTTSGGVASGTDLLKTTYAYTTDNRLASVTLTNLSTHGVANSTQVTTYAYTEFANGMLASVSVDGPIAGTGDQSITRYDALGNTLSLENSLGQKVIYSGQNGLGEPGRATNANGGITDYTYDARGRVTRVRTYLGGTAQDALYAYDADGRLASITDPDGVVRNYSYASGRDLPATVSIDSTGLLDGGGTQEQRSFYYNLLNQPTIVRDVSIETRTVRKFECLQPAGASPRDCVEPNFYLEQETGPVVKRSSTRWYDELGRPRADIGNNGQNRRYTYDLNGNITTITDSLNRVTTLTYDALDRLVKTVDPLNGVTQFNYDLGDRLVWVKDPRGLITSYVYDGFGQLWAQVNQDTGTTSFEYDTGGQRTKMTRNDGTATTYGYDGLGRLVSQIAGGLTHGYTYDTCSNGKGRLCRIVDPDGELDYTYSPEGLRLSQAQRIGSSSIAFGQAYSYDGMGRLNRPGNPGGHLV